MPDVELLTFRSTRGKLQTFAGVTLEAMALTATAVDNDDPAVTSIEDFEETTGAGRVELTGVTWDTTGALDALKADDTTVPDLNGETGQVCVYAVATGEPVALLRFPPRTVVGDLPVLWPGGNIAVLGDDDDTDALPAGGTEGQALRKNSPADGDASWQDDPAGGLTSGYVVENVDDVCDVAGAYAATPAGTYGAAVGSGGAPVSIELPSPLTSPSSIFVIVNEGDGTSPVADANDFTFTCASAVIVRQLGIGNTALTEVPYICLSAAVVPGVAGIWFVFPFYLFETTP